MQCNLPSPMRANLRIEVGATSNVVVYKGLARLLVAKLFEWICPKNIAHQAVSRWFTKSVDLQVHIS
jgi:hypothetical protein